MLFSMYSEHWSVYTQSVPNLFSPLIVVDNKDNGIVSFNKNILNSQAASKNCILY